MTKTRPSLRRFRAVYLLLLTCGLAGCLKGERHTAIKYDAKTDSFQCLHVFTGIAGEKPEDLQHLHILWRNRNHLVILPPGFIFDQAPALLRVDAHHFKFLNLGEGTTTEPPLTATGIDLDTITIQPGQFFLGPQKTLGCYHRMTIPGATLDAALTLPSRDLSDLFQQIAADELKRRQEGGATSSWKDYRSSSKDSDETGRETPATQPELLACLEEASLRRLMQAAFVQEIRIKRRGSLFYCTLPLTSVDCSEAKASLEHFKKKWLDELSKEMAPSSLLRAVGSVQATILQDDQLRLSLDIGDYLQIPGDDKLDPKSTQAYRDTVASVEGQGFAIRKDVTLEKLFDAFQKQ